jgi:phosphohistidine phosphatase
VVAGTAFAGGTMGSVYQTRLIVMRHAKAGELPGGPDAERALRPRGRRDATAAGRWLRDRGLCPDLVLCSPARRARQTWAQVAAELPAGPRMREDPLLYLAGAGQLLDIIRDAPAQAATLMYVGHNPAAGQLAAALTGLELGFPTCAIAVIELPGPWPQAWAGTGYLAASWTPAAGGSDGPPGPDGSTGTGG